MAHESNPKEGFTQSGDGITISNDNKTIKSTTFSENSAYGGFTIDSLSQQTYCWKLKVHKTGCDIHVGIIDIRNKVTDGEYCEEDGAYCYTHDGFVHPGEVEKGNGFSDGDTVCVELNMKKGVIKWIINETQDNETKIENIKKDKNVKYQLAVMIRAVGSHSKRESHLSILDFYINSNESNLEKAKGIGYDVDDIKDIKEVLDKKNKEIKEKDLIIDKINKKLNGKQEEEKKMKQEFEEEISNKNNIISKKEIDINELKQEQDKNIKNIERYKMEIKQLNEEKDQKQKENYNLRDERESKDKMIQELKQEKDINEDKYSSLKMENEKIQKQLSEMKENLKRQENINKDLLKKTQEHQQQIQQLEQDVKEKEEEKQEIETKLSKKASKISQNEKDLKQLNDEILEIKEKNEMLVEDANKANMRNINDINDLKQEKKQYEQEIEQLKQANSRNVDDINKLNQEITAKQLEYEKLKTLESEAIQDDTKVTKYAMTKSKEENKILIKQMEQLKDAINAEITNLDELHVGLQDASNQIRDPTQKRNEDQTNNNNIKGGGDYNNINNKIIQDRLKKINENIKKAITGEEITELPALETIEVLEQMEDLQQETTQTIQQNTKKDKNHTLDKLQCAVVKLKRVKSKNETAFENITTYATSYLSDQFPLIPATIIAHTTLLNWIDEYIDPKTCSSFYVGTRWTALGLILFYLTWIGYRCSKFRSHFKRFVFDFYRNWVVFVLLLTVQTSLPPLPCYVNDNDAKYIELSGVISMIIFAGLLSLCASPWFIYYYSKYIYSSNYHTKPFGIRNFDVEADGDGAVLLPEKIIKSKENIGYIKKITYEIDDNGGISIVGVKLNGFDDIDFDGSQKRKEQEIAGKLTKHLDNNDGEEEEDGIEEKEEEEQEEEVEEDEAEKDAEDKEEEEEEETKENVLDETGQKIGKHVDKGLKIYDFVNMHLDIDGETKRKEKNNVIKFSDDEYCTKVIIFAMEGVDSGDIKQIIGLQFVTNLHKSSDDNPHCIGITHLRNTTNKLFFQRHIIDPNKEKGKDHALTQIKMYNNDKHNIIGLAFAFSQVIESKVKSNGKDTDKKQEKVKKTVNDKEYMGLDIQD